MEGVMAGARSRRSLGLAAQNFGPREWINARRDSQQRMATNVSFMSLFMTFHVVTAL